MYNAVLVLLIIIDIALVVANRIDRAVKIFALQGIVLGLLPVVLGLAHSWHILFMLSFAVFVKACVIPYCFYKVKDDCNFGLNKCTSSFSISRILIFFVLSIGVSFIISKYLSVQFNINHLLVGSLITFLTGFIIIVAHKVVFMQVVGYLLIENGIYIFSMLLARSIPLLLELCILINLVIGMLLMLSLVKSIAMVFDTLNTRCLIDLKD